MCTISKGIVYPDKDLTVFKVFERKKDGTLRSIFYHFNWSIGESYRTYSQIPVVTKSNAGMMLRGMCFHSYQYVLDAIKAVKDLKSMSFYAFTSGWDSEFVVCRCTIPKESAFVYEGEVQNADRGTSSCYVSEMLRVEEILDVSLYFNK